MIDNAKPKMNILRVVICAALMSLIMVLMLYLYCNQVQSIIYELEADSNPMDNFVWVVRNAANIMPVIALAIFASVVYSGDGNIRGLYHREQRLEYIIAMFFTFLVMLPFIYTKSKNADAELSETTLLEQTCMWFATQIIPFIILIMYHGVRYRAELEEVAE